MSLSRLLCPLLFGVWLLLPLTSGAAIFVVDSVGNGSDGDLSDGACKDTAGACTLRAAIQEANLTVAADRIEFAIPGAGPHEILPVPLNLPAITRDLVIDGYTQPGASENGLAVGTDAQLQIEIAGAGGDGIQVLGGRVALKGLAIRGYTNGVLFDALVSSVAGSALLGCRIESTQSGVLLSAAGVRVGGVANRDRNLISNNSTGISVVGDGNFIVNNLIGTDQSGMAPVGNITGITLGGDGTAVTDNVISGNNRGVVIGFVANGNTLARNIIGLTADGGAALDNALGIRIQGSGNQIGLPNVARPSANANVISANSIGVHITGNGNSVQGNFLGTGPGGSGTFGNATGLWIEGSDNVIGAPATGRGEANVIANGEVGIAVQRPFNSSTPTEPVNNSLRTNRVFGNWMFDIDLGLNGVLDIDPGDVDEGANHLQNAPTLDRVTVTPGQTEIIGKLDSGFGSYTLDFYSSAACDAGGDTGSGRFFLGSDTVLVTGVGVDFTAVLPQAVSGGAFTAMATDANGNSSELGPCFEAATPDGADLSVSATSDANGAVVAPGDDVRIEVSVTNAGPVTATNVPVVIARPAGFDGWSSTGNGSYDEASGVWSVGDLAPGASATRVFDATIGASSTGLLTVLALAEQDLHEADVELAGNRSSVSFDVRSGAHLAITQSLPSSALPGQTIALDVRVTNEGPQAAVGVTISGRLDAGFELDEASAPEGVVYNPETGNWSFAAGDLADGDTVQFTLPVRIAADVLLGSGLQHTVYTAALHPRDPSPSLSTGTVGTGATADLNIVEFTHRRIAETGVETLETVIVENLGPDDVEGFELLLYSVYGSGLTVADPPYPTASCPGRPEDRIAGLTCRFGPLRSGETLEIKLVGVLGDIEATVRSHPSSPYFDPNKDNDTMRGYVRNRPICGLFGIEAPLCFGVLLALRGRKGRAAFRRIFPGAALAAIFLGGGSAHAAPVAFTLDPTASVATISLSGSLGAPDPATASVSGNVAADIALAEDGVWGLTAQSLRLTGAALAFSEAEILLTSAPLYELSFATSGLGASLSGPARSGFVVGPGLSLFDLSGSALAFDTGSILVTGTYFGVPVSETVELAAGPFNALLTSQSVAQLQIDALGGADASVRLSLPFSAPLHLSVAGESVTLTIAGTLVANGVAVPEPAAACLLAPALFALGALRTQMCRSSSSQRSRGSRKRAGDSGERSSAP